MQEIQVTAEESLILSLSTLTYLYAIPPSPTVLYEVIIRMTTFFNCIWHLSRQPYFSGLSVLAIGCDTVWFLLDTFLSYNTPFFTHILLINMGMKIVYMIVLILEKEGVIRHVMGHSIWYQLVALKGYYIAASLNSLNNSLAV